jgi:hypothetical protein
MFETANLGKTAFELLSFTPNTIDEFEGGMKGYFLFIDELRERISEVHDAKSWVFKNPNGETYQPDFQNADNSWILDVAWGKLTKPFAGEDLDELSKLYGEVFLFHVFHEIENALIGMEFDGRDAVVAAIEAANALANAMAIKSSDELLQKARREMSLQGAMAKLAKDPKQTAKQFVKDCWLTWQEEPERYKSKAAFAKDMLQQDQCKSLTSQVKITDWCREWEKSHPAG